MATREKVFEAIADQGPCYLAHGDTAEYKERIARAMASQWGGIANDFQGKECA